MTAVWITLLVLGLTAEGVALARKRMMKDSKDTLSDQVWAVRTVRWVRGILIPFWSWMTYHFWIEPDSVNPSTGVWWDDWIIIGFFFLIAVSFNLYGKKSDNQ